MVGAAARVLLWLVVGEAAARLGSLPIPGPVIGLTLLSGDLIAHGQVLEPLAALADGVLGHLAMLFVPAGVGVIVHLDLLRVDLAPIAAAVIGGTCVTVAVTALVADRFGAAPAGQEAPLEQGTHDARA